MERIGGMLRLKDKDNKSLCVVGMSESVIRKILKSRTLSPYEDGISMGRCEHGIRMSKCEDGFPMAADTQGLKDDLFTLRPYLTIDSTALNYDDLARSIMARWGDVIPMARCGDVIPLAMCMAMCKDVIRMAADTQGLKDNKSSYKDDLFPLSPYVTTGSNKDLARCVDEIPMACDTRASMHGDGIPMAGDTQGLEDNKSSNEDHLFTLRPYYVTTGSTALTGLEDNKSPYVTYKSPDVTGMSVSFIRQGGGIPMAADSRGIEDNKSKTLRSPYLTTGTTLVALPYGDVIPMACDTRGATRHGDGIPMDAADSRGLEENKSKTLRSPYLTTGTTEVTLNCRDGTLMTKSKDRIVMGWLKDVIPMARCKDGDTRGLKDNKSSNKDDGFVYRRPYLTTDSTALYYDDLVRSIMARWGDVIPIARCGDVIPMARFMAMCKVVIRMVADTQGFKDNKSRKGDYLFPLSHYVNCTSPYVTDTSDVLIIAGHFRSLEYIKSRTLSPYVTRMPAMGHGGVIPMDDYLQGLEDGTLRLYYVTTGSTALNYDYLARSIIMVGEDVSPMARCHMASDTRGLEDNKSSNEDDGTTLVSLPYGGRITMEADARVRGTMESLPLDVVQDILSRVPAESVLECKLVCKKWLTLIRERNFTNLHLSRVINNLHGGDNSSAGIAARVESCLFLACGIDDPDEYITLLFHGAQPSDRISNDEKYIYSENLKRIYHPPMHNESLLNHLVGSCNGLVCTIQLHNRVLDPIYICNPLTREYVYLPELVVKKEDVVDPDWIEDGEVDMRSRVSCGFGYVRSTNEYKVVRIHYLKPREGNVEIYTLGSGRGWRAIGKISYRLDTWTAGTYVNDAIYWTSGRKVVAFDLADEEFRSVPVPACWQNLQREDRYGIVALGRHLCLYVDKLRLEIWSLMTSSNSKETWCRQFDIDYEAVVGSREKSFLPILLTKSGEIIFLYAEYALYCYDTKTAFLKIISGEAPTSLGEASTDGIETIEAIAHVNTLASLEAIGEPSKRYTVCSHRVGAPSDDVIDTTPFRLR